MIRVIPVPSRAPAAALGRGNNAIASADVTKGNQAVALTPVVRSTKCSVTSTAGGGAVETTIYLWNNDYQNVTDNGSGANSITYNYEDGFAGVLTSRRIYQANMGQGQVLYGGYIECFAAGVADPTGLSNAEPAVINYVGRGSLAVPTVIEVDDNFSRADNSTGIGVFTCEQPFDIGTQFQLNINGAAGTTYVINVKLYFYPNFKI